MLSRVERFFRSPSRIDIRIHLEKKQPIYTNEDEVSGHVIIHNRAEVDLARITIKLSGSATSRLDSGKLTESHELFKKSEEIFPPSHCAGFFTAGAVTVSPGEHAFPFSIMFPQASECYKTGTVHLARKQSPGSQPHHLLRKLPPSTGNRSTWEEIRYMLEASVAMNGLILSTIRHPLHGPKDRKTVICTSEGSDLLYPPLFYEIEAEILNGPFLLLGHPIALRVKTMNMNDCNNAIYLHNFQSMLIETTEVRARGSMQSLTRSWVIQTAANLRQPLVPEYSPTVRSLLILNGSLWSRHRVPLHLTPTFETCNLSRSYKLEIRLGIGFCRNNTRILEFQFPVYVLSPSSTRPSVGSPAPTLHHHERDALEK
ncbi:uncharacterized protein CDV56_100491 [Aspergillus thermomutatus]|uniref:Arrestin-like N-terminal domain-containing protein n=1 Tax=Aspergillus thermomutatus TaxID=41047 RepID=A0A397FZ35_ASPTH|nr:uncharacterized protein CDV56_100491 [Aspergillus thermomutatus]RHZ43069.1 hypothetical protein CDV56_100491 [Aspergillus thermomutatus]